MRYLLDSYALVAFFGAGDQRFGKYVAPGALVSVFTLLETYYRLLEIAGPETADALFSILDEHYSVARLDGPDVPHVARLRRDAHRRRKRWSYADAANLYLARREGARLVTGDLGLKGAPGVEFVGGR